MIVTIYLERGCIERLWKERTGSNGQERASQACKWRWRRNGEGPTFGWAKTEMTKLRKIKKDPSIIKILKASDKEVDRPCQRLQNPNLRKEKDENRKLVSFITLYNHLYVYFTGRLTCDPATMF